MGDRSDETLAAARTILNRDLLVLWIDGTTLLVRALAETLTALDVEVM